MQPGGRSAREKDESGLRGWAVACPTMKQRFRKRKSPLQKERWPIVWMYPAFSVVTPYLDSDARRSDVFVGAAVVDPPLVLVFHHTFGEYHIGNLAPTLPLFLRSQERFVGTREQLARIILIEERPGAGVDEIVVCSVIDEEDSGVSDDRRRPRLHYSRIESAGTPREHRLRSSVGPVKKIIRRSQPHVIALVRRSSE